MPNGGKAISLSYARQLVKNYEDNKLGKTLLPDDTQAVWFSKETILEALGLAPDLNTNGITGIRMYFAAYETKDGFPTNVFDQNKLTMVMVQTNDTEIEIDRGGIPETAFLDNVNDTTTTPDYPSTDEPEPTARNVFNDTQINPPPGNISILGLMKF